MRYFAVQINKHTAMAMTGLRFLILVESLLVDRMVRVLCWPWTNRPYVYIFACVLAFDVLISYYWCLMKYEVVNAFTLMRHFGVHK